LRLAVNPNVVLIAIELFSDDNFDDHIASILLQTRES